MQLGGSGGVAPLGGELRLCGGWVVPSGEEGGWRSGEVHGPQCVVVDLNGLGQRLGVPAVALP